MQSITPTKHDDGTESVTLWGKTFDVTGQKKLTAFKREFKIVRPKKVKQTDEEKTEDE